MTPPEIQILAYFKQHPNASDTLEGIAQWWLLQHSGEIPTRILRDSLDHLILIGLISVHQDSSGRKHFRLSQTRRFGVNL